MDDVTKYGPVDGDPIIEKKRFRLIKREFDPKLEPGTEEVVQKVKMERNNHNTNYENPLTGERVGKGEPTEKTTKEPVDEIVHYGGEKVPQGHKMNLIQTHRKVAKKKFQVNQVSKIQIQEKL